MPSITVHSVSLKDQAKVKHMYENSASSIYSTQSQLPAMVLRFWLTINKNTNIHHIVKHLTCILIGALIHSSLCTEQSFNDPMALRNTLCSVLQVHVASFNEHTSGHPALRPQYNLQPALRKYEVFFCHHLLRF